MKEAVINQTICFHCGVDCDANDLSKFDNKYFCCNGCKTVYQILNKSDLCDYYSFNKVAGVKVISENHAQHFSFLDNQSIAAKFITFSNQQQTAVTFYLPQIHCSSCLWLLENLRKLNSHIFFSLVNFPAKEVTIYFNHHLVSIRSIAELLVSVGYEPHITLSNSNEEVKVQTTIRRTELIKIGIAGFCFANIMMLSFPEYLGLDSLITDGLSVNVFRTLNLLLSIPVLIYSGSSFVVNSWYGIKSKILNIDTPIALALSVTFCRSAYEIISATGGGYLDSMSGIIFFMLVGRAFQTKVFANIQFNRDYTAYFPIAVCKIDEKQNESFVLVNEIKVDDSIRIKNNEVIPIDGLLLKGNASIDYSFLSGESEATNVLIGEIVYAGGKQTSGIIDMLVVKPFSQSNFTRLWNSDAFKKEEKQGYSFSGIISNYFAVSVIIIAFVSFIYWMNVYPQNAWNALTAVLIVACPCALLVTTTFTQGFILNIFGKHGLFLKNGNILQTIPFIKHIVFDKTGTLTYSNKSSVKYIGEQLNEFDLAVFASLFAQSLHPLSKSIAQSLSKPISILNNVKEILGAGIEAWENDHYYKAGSAKFIGVNSNSSNGAEVWIAINNKVYGKFEVENQLRENVDELIHELPYSITVLSGDNNKSQSYLTKQFNRKVEFQFNQSPENKLNYISQLQQSKQLVMMIGDGLNDAGALQKSNIGIAVVDNTIQFSPASDAILLANKLPYLNQFIKAANLSKQLIILTFIISLIYNVVGLYFSITAQLSPIIAAILMPLSTISIVAITLIGSIYIEKKYLINV